MFYKCLITDPEEGSKKAELESISNLTMTWPICTMLANTTKTAGADNRELHLGSLYSSEHQKVFGYVINTRIKFIIITDNSNTTLRDNEIRRMFRKLHTAYTNIMANPFYLPVENITSCKFDAMVKGIMGIREN